LRDDLGLKKNDLVFLHSGLIGLGKIDGGISVITDAFAEVLLEGVLVVPSFTYSWCNNQAFDPLRTECPNDVGGYSQQAWKDNRFIRSGDPNFSVAILQNAYNEEAVQTILNIGNSCFGVQSVFDHMYQITKERNGYIILLGGAHSDCVFRTTFIHYVEEQVGVLSRYLKKFYDPSNSKKYVQQLVRFVSMEEYQTVTGKDSAPYVFPVVSDYSYLGNDLLAENLVTQVRFGYSTTRMVSIRPFCDFIEKKIRMNPDYFVKSEKKIRV
jgi:aminoglycoside N3'-acetyltransferase